jgi:hypothetical protein
MIKVIDFEDIEEGYSNLYDGLFEPETLAIYLSKDIKQNYPDCWRRMYIIILIHELTHLFEYIFCCRCNLNKFDKLKNPEARAERIESLFMKLFGICID